MRSDRRRGSFNLVHHLEALEPRMLLSTTWLVSSTADDGTSGTLRYAINNSAAGDTIQFASSVFSFGSQHTITLVTGQLELSHPVTITGPDPSVVSISANNLSRVFQIDSGVAATLSGLTITRGNAGSANGGAINDQGTLNLSSSVIQNSTASHSGGLYILQGVANVTNCTFSNNTAATYDGAVGCDTGTTATFSGCTFNNNTAMSGGGAIVGYDTSLTLTNDTFTANAATGGPGGAIDNLLGTCTISNCTIVGNTSTQAGAGVYAGASVTIDNSIIAQNTKSGSPSDLAGAALSTTCAHNLVGDGSGGLLASNGNRLGSPSNLLSPALYPLASYGGPTLTMLPEPGSPVIDAGNNSLVTSNIATDQRGFTRIINGTVDIGADEYGGPLIVSQTNSGTITIGATAAGGIMTVVNGVETDYPPGAFSSFQLTVGGYVSGVSVLATVVPTTLTGSKGPPTLGHSILATVGKNGSVQDIQQPLTINYLQSTLDDSSDTTSRHVVIEPNGSSWPITHGLAPADIVGGGAIELPAASGNVVDVLINGGAGITGHTPAGGVTTINLPRQALFGYSYNFNEVGAGSDVVNVDDSADTTPRNISIDPANSNITVGLGSGIYFEQSANLTLNLKCGSGGNTLYVGNFGPLSNIAFNIDTGSGNDTSTIQIPSGVSLNLNGDAGNDAVNDRSSSGKVMISNSAGKDSLAIDGNSYLTAGPVTFDTVVPLGSTHQWQRITGFKGGEIDYDPAGMAEPVTFTQNDTVVTYNILSTPDYPAAPAGVTPTPGLSLNVQGTINILGAGANSVFSVNSAIGPVNVDFSTGAFQPGAQISITSGSLNLQGSNAADPFTVSSAQVSHGSTTLLVNCATITMNTGTFNLQNLDAFLSAGHTLNVDGFTTTLVLPGDTSQSGGDMLTLNIDAGRVVFAPQSPGQVSYLTSAFVTFADGGQMDIANDRVATNGGWAALALTSGYNHGAWNGPGIVCSTLTPGYGIAYDYGVVQKALIGDTNADGSVNLQDFLTLTRSFGSTNANWHYGDFNYDGAVNLSDLLALTRNFGRSLPPTLSATDLLLPDLSDKPRTGVRRV